MLTNHMHNQIDQMHQNELISLINQHKRKEMVNVTAAETGYPAMEQVI